MIIFRRKLKGSVPMSTRIISFFSDLRPGLTERLYRYPGQQGRPPLSGAHTNEAPLYYLLTTFAPVDV